MKSLQFTPPAELLQKMITCVKNGEEQLKLIPHPRQLYKEHAGSIKMRLDQAFGQFWESQELGERSGEDIARFAGELKALEENRSENLARIKAAYNNQTAAAVQMTCDKLLPAMGPSYVKQALQKIPIADLKDYLPTDTRRSDQEPAVQAQSGHTTAENNELGRSRARAGVDPAGIEHQNPTQKSQPHLAGVRRPFSESNADSASQWKRQKTHNVDMIEAPRSCVREPESHKGGEQSSNQVDLPSTAPVSDLTRAGTQIPHENEVTPSTTVRLEASEHNETPGDGRNPSKNEVSVNITVVDADENVIGSMGTVEPWNDHTAAILKIPVKRAIKIRRGRQFTEDDLYNVCDKSDPRGAKLLACMIQAGGRTMQTRCGHCRRGPFEDCVVLDGPLFTRCGNCEWARQRCQGASGPLATEQAGDNDAQQPCAVNSNDAIASGDNSPLWEIRQIKTQYYASPDSVKQCLTWVEHEKYFKHWVIMHHNSGQVGVLREPVDFNIRLQEISEIKWNSCILHVKMKGADPTVSTLDRPAQGDVMVAFERPKTAHGFVDFCRQRGLKVTREEIEEMARTWLNMKSKTLLSHESDSLNNK